eukprot:2348004-Lingulodinium_polyedra.AAC.1
MRGPVFRSARGVRERAICEPLRPRTVDSSTLQRGVSETLRYDAVESPIRGCSGAQIARSRAPCADRKTGPRMERAS